MNEYLNAERVMVHIIINCIDYDDTITLIPDVANSKNINDAIVYNCKN